MLTNGSLKTSENAVNGMNVPFLPVKLTANWNFLVFNGLILTVNEKARKS